MLIKYLKEYLSFNRVVNVGYRLSNRHGGFKCLYLLMYRAISQAQYHVKSRSIRVP